MLSYAQVGALIGILLAGSSETRAADTDPLGDVRAGRAYAIQFCSECHEVLAYETHSLPKGSAPSFYAVANTKSSTAIGLSVFLMTPHPTMPNLIIAEQDRHDVIAYIMSLKGKKKNGLVAKELRNEE